MAVTAAMVKELRELTGLGMMDCKKALTESDGDMDARDRSAAAQQRGESREESRSHRLGRSAWAFASPTMAAMRCSSRSTSRPTSPRATRSSLAFVARVRDVAFEKRTSDVAALLAGGLDAERETLVQEHRRERRRCGGSRCSKHRAGKVASYLHADNRKASLVALIGGDDELGRDLAMHVTASKPLVVSGADVAPEIVAKEREIFTAQAQDSGKPADIIAKMVEGRVRKFLAEVSLLEQPFVKDPNTRVGQLLAQKKARCTGFVRFEVGEGIDKVETDFAAEVAAQVRGKG